jgi:hypothetical protein
MQFAQKSMKKLGLAAVTIATVIAGAAASSFAATPARVVFLPGRASIAIFEAELQSYKIGCPALDNLWRRVPHQAVNAQQYDQLASGPFTFNGTGDLPCNSPNRVKAYVSPAFGRLIVVDGTHSHVVSSSDFFNALGVSPKQLTQQQGEQLLRSLPPGSSKVSFSTAK